MKRFNIKIGHFAKGYMEDHRSDGEYVKYADIKGMILTEQQRKEFEAASRPLMEWLSKNCHPHVKVLVDYSSSEMLEGIVIFSTEDYIT